MNAKVRLIYRAEHSKENPYFQMLRAAAQNRELTFEARGVLAYILSKPDDWKVQPADLEQQCKKSVVYRVLAELIKHGYIDRVQERNDKKQIIAWHYLVHEYPLPKKQEVALPEVGKLEVEKTDITEDREEQNRDKNKKENNSDTVSLFIKAWLDGQSTLPVTNQYKNKTNRTIAKAISDAGYSTEQITVYTRYLAQDQYWKGKLISLQYIGNNIAAAMPKEQTPTPSSAPPPPAERETPLTADEAAAREKQAAEIWAMLNESIVEKTVAA